MHTRKERGRLGTYTMSISTLAWNHVGFSFLHNDFRTATARQRKKLYGHWNKCQKAISSDHCFLVHHYSLHNNSNWTSENSNLTWWQYWYSNSVMPSLRLLLGSLTNMSCIILRCLTSGHWKLQEKNFRNLTWLKILQ